MLDLLGAIPLPAAVADNLSLPLPSPSSFLSSLSSLSSSLSASHTMSISTTNTFFPALLTLLLSYPLLAPSFPSVRQRAWIITSLASCVMTCAAVPFCADYLSGGVSGVKEREWSVGVNRFFQAYLTADMLIGFFAYRSQIGFLTGWIHHLVYILITETAIRSSWAHLFCLAAIMEAPTFVLGMSTLVPRLRSNVFFAVMFFATRICFHVVLFCGLVGTPGLATPAAILALVFPLHAMWFKGCIAGFVRRYKARVASTATSAEGVVIQKERAPEIGIDGSDKSGVPKTNPKSTTPTTTTITSLPPSLLPLPLQRLRMLSSTLLAHSTFPSSRARWLVGPAGWVSPSVTLWLERGREGGRWGVRNAILTRLKERQERKARMAREGGVRRPGMARRMSAGLIAVLPKVQVPGREVRQKVIGYVRERLAAPVPVQ